LPVTDTDNEAGPDQNEPDPPAGEAAAGKPRHLAPSSPLVRAVGVVGTIFIVGGLLVAGFAVYLLWGTGIRTHQQQHDLKSQFARELAAIAPTTTAPPASAASSTTTTTTTPPPPVDLNPRLGEAMAHIEIPSIGVDWIAVEGTGLDQLAKGPGHYKGTPFPGQPGNVAFAGHRTTHGAPFNRVDELKPGDQIVFTTIQGRFVYSVTGQEVVAPTNLSVLTDKGDNRLTLTSCHPKFSASKRIVITAMLQTQPVAAPPTTTAPPGGGNSQLGPDDSQQAAQLTQAPGGFTDALLTGAACLGIGIGAWQTAERWLRRRWGRWLLYLAVAPAFLFVLFFFYEDVSSLLPSDF
jgi:sortase A